MRVPTGAPGGWGKNVGYGGPVCTRIPGTAVAPGDNENVTGGVPPVGKNWNELLPTTKGPRLGPNEKLSGGFSPAA